MDLEIKDVSFDWASEEVMAVSPWNLRRLDGGDARFYIDQEGDFLMSVTTFVSEVILSSAMKGLHDWRARVGEQEANRVASESADYGTLMHDQFGDFIMNKGASFRGIKENLRAFAQQEGYKETGQWQSNLMQDISAFAQWIHDHKVKPIAVEFAVGDTEWGLGGTIDLIAEVTVREKGHWGKKYKSGKKEGEPKKTYRNNTYTAMIDYKSGRHGFYPSHVLQLDTYRRIWNRAMPIEVEKVFNWRPKDWRTKPTYQFKDQSDQVPDELFEAYLTLIKHSPLWNKKKQKLPNYKGTIKYGEQPNIEFRKLNDFL